MTFQERAPLAESWRQPIPGLSFRCNWPFPIGLSFLNSAIRSKDIQFGPLSSGDFPSSLQSFKLRSEETRYAISTGPPYSPLPIARNNELCFTRHVLLSESCEGS